MTQIRTPFAYRPNRAVPPPRTPRLFRNGVAVALTVWALAAAVAYAATTTGKTTTSAGKTAPSTTKSTTAKPAATNSKPAATPPKATGVVATVGTRTIDQLDIQRAAAALEADPLRTKDPAKWRRSLLDRCVDRELLAMEAERQGLDKDSTLEALLAEREYSIFWREIYKRVLIPQLTPTADELAQAYASKQYRLADLSVILLRTDLNPQEMPLVQRIAAAARGGARFDSLARLYSAHPPTKAKGGRIGWVLSKEVNPAWFEDAKKASPGDVLGPYQGPVGSEIYKVAGWQELSKDSLTHLIYFERSRTITGDYQKKTLAKYHFAIDSTQVKPAVFTIASESPDSILASLRPDGTREKQGARPALGVLARYDGGEVTFPDLLRGVPVNRKQIGGLHIDSADELYVVCARAVISELTSRDARDRGIDKDPLIARELRLVKDEMRTSEMVRRHVPSADEASVRAYFDAHPDLFRRPKSWRVRAVTFASADSAQANAKAWRAYGLVDSMLTTRRDIHEARGTTVWTASPGPYAVARYATLDLLEGGTDPLTKAARGATAGSIVGPVALPYGGHTVMQVLSVEDSRPASFDEAKILAHRLKREDAESRWVDEELTKLRAATPARVLPGRLEATKLAERGTTTPTGGVAQ